VYLTRPLSQAVRVSGTPRIAVRAALTGRSPYLTALLVDYGEADRVLGTMTVAGQDCIGPGIPEDPGCFAKRVYRTVRAPFRVVSRGWLDVRNRHAPWLTEPVTPGQAYTFHWDLQPQEHVFAAGHRLGIVIISTDRDHTLRYRAGTQVDVRLGLSHALLPLAPA